MKCSPNVPWIPDCWFPPSNNTSVRLGRNRWLFEAGTERDLRARSTNCPQHARQKVTAQGAVIDDFALEKIADEFVGEVADSQEPEMRS